MTVKDFGTGLDSDLSLHMYVNSSTGNDSNNGRSSGSPKLTIQNAIDSTPDIYKSNTYVVFHLSGTFEEKA